MFVKKSTTTRDHHRLLMCCGYAACLLGILVDAGAAETSTGSSSLPIEISSQYRFAPRKTRGGVMCDVYVENHGTAPIKFRSVLLDGAKLPVSTGGLMWWVTTQGTRREVGLFGKRGRFPAPENVLWWQFYPSEEVKPGQTVLFQICFQKAKASKSSQQLSLLSADGRSATFTIPPYVKKRKKRRIFVSGGAPIKRKPDPYISEGITAVTYTKNYSRIFVLYDYKEDVVDEIRINGVEIPKYLAMAPPVYARNLRMLAFDAPVKITTGTPVHMRLSFRSGGILQTLVRAYSGVNLDAFVLKTEENRENLKFDKDPVVQLLHSCDVGCVRMRHSHEGYTTAPVINQRLDLLRKKKDKLSAIHFCRRMSTSGMEIYGTIADVVLTNPFSLTRGSDAAVFIESEEEAWEAARLASRPRPWMWIPEVYRPANSHRFIEPAELEVMMWAAFANGCKGLNYFANDADGDDAGFEENEALQACIRGLNAQIRGKSGMLAPLTFISSRIVGDKVTGAKIYRGWAGDLGMLIMVRNLDYETDSDSNDGGKSLRFKVKAKPEFSLRVSLPTWLKYRNVRDFLTNRSVSARPKSGQLNIQLGKLESYRLLWIENAER